MSGTIEEINLAAEHLRKGGVVAFPTETVYGLGADAFNEKAIARVYQLKGRPARNPLIVHVSGPEMARRAVAVWPDEADALAREFWPGPLSIILPRSARLPPSVTAGGPGVAVRCPLHPTALALLFEFAGPLVGPSANLSGQVSPTTAGHVREAFGNTDVLILEGGRCTGGIESTVLSLLDVAHPRVLRPGLIGPEEIARILGRSVASGPPSREGAGAPLDSPGLLGRHYAPRTPARLFGASEWPAVLGEEPVVVITHRLRDVPSPHHLITLPHTPEEYAAGLYAAIREADARGAGRILIERPPVAGTVWHAIADRLRRATSEE
jgi:L-threonylcarbamoyladenylate synthase